MARTFDLALARPKLAYNLWKMPKRSKNMRDVIIMLTEGNRLTLESLWSLPHFCSNSTYKYFGGMLVQSLLVNNSLVHIPDHFE